MSRRPSHQQTMLEAIRLLRRMKEVVQDYHETLLEIATQTRGKGAEIARKTLERQN